MGAQLTYNQPEIKRSMSGKTHWCWDIEQRGNECPGDVNLTSCNFPNVKCPGSGGDVKVLQLIFRFKLLHRRLATNYFLKKIGIKIRIGALSLQALGKILSNG